MMKYPAFFEEHLTHVIEEYEQARSKISDPISFVFFTDLHIHLNGRASVPLIREIGKRTGVNTVLCGGDFCWAWGSEAECYNQLEDSFAYLQPLRETMNLYIARGNHDATVRNSMEDDRGYTMPYMQLQEYFAANNSPADGAVDGKLYFYADDPESRTRYVVLDTSERHLSQESGWGVLTGMEPEQLEWLCNTALCFDHDEGWSVVVMGHIPCAEELAGFSPELIPLSQILMAYKNRSSCEYADFSKCKAELVMYLAGHSHKDRDAVSDGVLHLTTGCDAYCRDDDMPRPVGTVENALIDLFLVDRETRTVQTFRIGAGKSRKLSY